MKEESYSDGKLGNGGQGSLANVESDGQGKAGNPGKDCLAPVPVCRFTSQEKTAIEQFLQEGVSQPANARARSMACAALKFAATLLLVAGVGMGVGDGNDFDDVGCSVAAKPPGCARCSGGLRPGKAGQTTPPHPNPSPPAERGPGGRPPACGQQLALGHEDEVKAVLLRLESKVDAMRVLAKGHLAVGHQGNQAMPPVSESEARRVFVLMQRLEGGPHERKAPLPAVFRLTVLEGHSQAKTARLCGCVPALISRRVKTIESGFGMSIERLRSYASALLEMEASVKGDKRQRRRQGPVGDGSLQDDNLEGVDGTEDDG